MKPFYIKLPATSANLGPGFDSVAIALELFLEVESTLSASYSIQATGRDADVCMSLKHNLLLSVYEDILRAEGLHPVPLAINMVNGIPLGMGCGSSAATRLAGVALANHFGELGWQNDRILLEACRLEGHPDNAAACWQGGFTVSATRDKSIRSVSANPPPRWKAILVLGPHAMATTSARAILPENFTRGDAIFNIQNTALLTAAFLAGRDELLVDAMQDRLHQPYRSKVCPLLPLLLPLAGTGGILGVALSGAGPAILMLHTEQTDIAATILVIQRQLAGVNAEILPVRLLTTSVRNE